MGLDLSMYAINIFKRNFDLSLYRLSVMGFRSWWEEPIGQKNAKDHERNILSIQIFTHVKGYGLNESRK